VKLFRTFSRASEFSADHRAPTPVVWSWHICNHMFVCHPATSPTSQHVYSPPLLQISAPQQTNMARLTFLALLAFYIMSATAQFGFFDQMFNGGSQQQQRPQDVRSDSSWYKAQYENGAYSPPQLTLLLSQFPYLRPVQCSILAHTFCSPR
jgi:hypothetical protein